MGQRGDNSPVVAPEELGTLCGETGGGEEESVTGADGDGNRDGNSGVHGPGADPG